MRQSRKLLVTFVTREFESPSFRMYYSYILKSQIKKFHYYGHTKDLAKRLKIHNSGRVRSTKAYKPFKLHYYEEYNTRLEAVQRELFYKSIEGYLWLKKNEII